MSILIIFCVCTVLTNQIILLITMFFDKRFLKKNKIIIMLINTDGS